MRVNGIGGDCFFVGIDPEMIITVGSRVMVGIIDSGDFDILLCNNATTKLKLTVGLADQYVTYYYPELGHQELRILK